LDKKRTKNPKILHRVIPSDSGGFNYKIERFHSTLRERTKTMRGFHGCLTSAQTILKGFEIYYNFIRKNMALNGLTPSQLAIPNLQLQNKNKWIEIIERGYENEKPKII
jgi:transposase-like protein